MRKSIFTLILVLLIVVSVLGGDLIYKVEKEINTTENKPVVIGEIETGKNKTLRIGVLSDTKENYAGISIETIEGSDAFLLESFVLPSGKNSKSVVVNVPGKRLRITANTSGKYKVFVWSE